MLFIHGSTNKAIQLDRQPEFTHDRGDSSLKVMDISICVITANHAELYLL